MYLDRRIHIVVMHIVIPLSCIFRKSWVVLFQIFINLVEKSSNLSLTRNRHRSFLEKAFLRRFSKKKLFTRYRISGFSLSVNFNAWAGLKFNFIYFLTMTSSDKSASWNSLTIIVSIMLFSMKRLFYYLYFIKHNVHNRWWTRNR